jgi:hypothetical protein
MVHVNNHSPFPAELFSFPDQDGQEMLVLVVSATFEGCQSDLKPADKQAPVQVADEHFGKPEITSVRREADVAVTKSLVDLVVNGTAYAPDGRPAQRVAVELQVADIQKRLFVYGDRFHTPLGTLTPAEPFVTMPIVYERAFGGSSAEGDDRKYIRFRGNPVGLGFRSLHSRVPGITTHAPNIEDANGTSHEVPAGFGFVSRGWSPRLEYAGTYDQGWIDTQWPLPPNDFDVRHYQGAPADQQSEQISGGERIRLVNLTPDGVWEFLLPQIDLQSRLIFADHSKDVFPKLDTVVIEPDTRRIYMSLRLKIPLLRNVHLREVCIGEVSGGYVLSRVRRKAFFDFGRTRRIGTGR